MRLAWSIVLVVACGAPQPPPPAPVETCKDAPAPAPAPPPPPAASSPTCSAAEPAVAEPTPPEKFTEKKGKGSCTFDAECVLTQYAGCCNTTCEPWASSVQDLARVESADGCATKKVKCPVPPKCAKSQMRAAGAVCRDGTCTARFERNDPGY